MDMQEGNGQGFTTKEIVIEIRDAVKELNRKVDRIDQQGSIGTRSVLEDHESRIRDQGERISFLTNSRVTREDIHLIRNDLASLKISLADRPQQVSDFHDALRDIDTLKSWRDTIMGEASVRRLLSDRVIAFAALTISLASVVVIGIFH